MEWMDARKSKFSIKSFHTFLGQERAEMFPTRAIWNSMVPTKVGFDSRLIAKKMMVFSKPMVFL